VRPAQPVEIFGNVSSPFGTLAIRETEVGKTSYGALWENAGRYTCYLTVIIISLCHFRYGVAEVCALPSAIALVTSPIVWVPNITINYLYVCLSTRISKKTRPIFTKFSIDVNCGRIARFSSDGSAYTSGFVGDSCFRIYGTNDKNQRRRYACFVHFARWQHRARLPYLTASCSLLLLLRPGRCAKYCDERVCVSVRLFICLSCLFAKIPKKPHFQNFATFSVHVTWSLLELSITAVQ